MIENKISAIIPVHKKCNIDDVVSCLSNFIEEIVIINSSDFKFKFENNEKVKIYNYEKKLNASQARNLGCYHSNKEILLFVDYDVLLSNKAVQFIKSLEEIKYNNIIGGVYKTSTKGKIFSNINSSILNYRFLQGKEKNNKTEFISSSHFLINKNKFEDIGKFNENINCWEDADFSFRAKFFDADLSLESKFDAVHLKEYNIFNHFFEISKKVYLASKIKISNLSLYKNSSGQITKRILSYLLPFLISIPLLILQTSLDKILLIFFITIISLTLINRVIFDDYKSSFLASLYLSITSPIFAFLNVSAKVNFLFKKIFRLTYELYDYFVCGIRVLFKFGHPIQFIQYVTSRCNLRCEHCFYKETLDKKDAGEISLDLLTRTAKSMKPLLWYSMAGGEPFIRKDLADIISKIQKETRPKIFSLPTNGWYTDKTFNSTLSVMQRLERGNFIIFFSIDGDQAAHDSIRGDNSYQKLKETYAKLSQLKKIYPRLSLGIIITVQDKNYKDFPELISKIDLEFKPSSISINLLRYHYKDAEKIDPKIIDGYEKAINEYEKIRNNRGYNFFWSFIIKAKEKRQKELILKVAKKDEFVTPCSAANLSYVGMEDGSIKACEILPNVLGNIYKEKIKTIFNSKKSKELRSEIVNKKCRCTYECAMSTNVLFNLDQQKKLISQTFKDLGKK